MYDIMGHWTQVEQSSFRTKFHRATPQTSFFLFFTGFGYMPYMKHHLPKAHYSPHHFVQLPPTCLSLNPTLILLVRKPHGPIPTHIRMILSTLGLIPHDFVFGLFSQKASYQLDVVHVYILISLPIHNRCGRLWDFRHTTHNLGVRHHIILFSFHSQG